MAKITLSSSKLNLFNDCARCFYDAENNNISRPRGIFPSLSGGMDIILKKFIDEYVNNVRGVPFFINAFLKSDPDFADHDVKFLEDKQLLKNWRFWRTAPRYIDVDSNVEVYGAFDHIVYYRVEDGIVMVPFDFKTKGSMPKDDGSQYYMTQMDIYNLLLKSEKFKVIEKAILMYVYPKFAFTEIDSLHIEFGYTFYKYDCSVERALKIIERAVKCLRGDRPDPSPSCEYCNLVMAKNYLDK